MMNFLRRLFQRRNKTKNTDERVILIRCLHPQVFYTTLDEIPMVEELGDYLDNTFIRDIEYRLEDPCWTVSPSGIRIVFHQETQAAQFVDYWQKKAVIVHEAESLPWTRSDPDFYGIPW